MAAEGKGSRDGKAVMNVPKIKLTSLAHGGGCGTRPLSIRPTQVSLACRMAPMPESTPGDTVCMRTLDLCEFLSPHRQVEYGGCAQVFA
jgi:hypothetical protein